jgi:transposase
MRARIPALQEALTGHFTSHHAFLPGKMLARVDGIDAGIAELDAAIEAMIAPFAAAAGRLDEIPGTGRIAAAIIIAEIGTDMTRFPTPGRLASRANPCSGRARGDDRRCRRRHRSADPQAHLRMAFSWRGQLSLNLWAALEPGPVSPGQP